MMRKRAQTMTLLGLGAPASKLLCDGEVYPASDGGWLLRCCSQIDVLLLLLQHGSCYSMDRRVAGRVLRCAYRDAPTSSSVASCARLETPSLA